MLSNIEPNNLIQLKNNTIFKIKSILLKRKRKIVLENVNESEIFCLGNEMHSAQTVFEYPSLSTDVGIVQGKFLEKLEVISLDNFRKKCILIHNEEVECVVSLLHN